MMSSILVIIQRLVDNIILALFYLKNKLLKKIERVGEGKDNKYLY